MKLRLFAVSGCIIFPCLVLAAQSPVLVSVSEEAHQDVHGRGKTVSIKITNLSGAAISAVAVRSSCVNRSDREKFNKVGEIDDTLTNYIDDDVLIPPGGTKEYRIGGGRKAGRGGRPRLLHDQLSEVAVRTRWHGRPVHSRPRTFRARPRQLHDTPRPRG